jgi:hypothetical protein
MADHDKRREWHWRRIEVIAGVVATIVAVIGLFITIGQNQGSSPSATDTRPQPTPTGSPNSGSEPTLPVDQYTVAYTDKALTLPNTNVSDPVSVGVAPLLILASRRWLKNLRAISYSKLAARLEGLYSARRIVLL